MLLRFVWVIVWLDLYWCVKTPSSGQSGSSSCLSTCPLQGGTVPAKTSQIPRHGRRTSAVPWIPCLTSVSCRSTAGREAATPTESTGWCPVHKHTDAGEVSDAFMMCSSLRRWTCPDTWQTSRDDAVLSSLRAAVFQQAARKTDQFGRWSVHRAHVAAHHHQTHFRHGTEGGGPRRRHVRQHSDTRWDACCRIFQSFFWLLPLCPGKDGSFCCCAGMWEAKPEDLEQSEAVFKVSDLFMYCFTD